MTAYQPLDFKDEIKEWEWVNTPQDLRGNRCTSKENFIEMSGMDEKAL